ncbi:copper amine oxidase N-terminal domain-containing protein [Desulfoscipio gibsoniae]
MNRFILFAVAVIVFTLANIVPAMAVEPIRVIVDGKDLSFDVSPKLENGRLMVPMRAIFEALDVQVEWDNVTNTIIGENLITKGSNIKLVVGRKTAYINDKAVELDMPAKVIEGRVLVPLRFVAEALGGNVEWTAGNSIVNIDSGFLRTSLGEYRFWLSKSNDELNELFVAVGKSAPEKLADLNLIIKYRPGDDPRPTLTAEKTSKGNVLLTAINNYGEPHVFNNVHSIYVNLANNTLQKASLHYAFRFEDNIKFYKEQIILTDGKKIIFIDDNTGTISKTINYKELPGEGHQEQDGEESYFIEGMGENYLIIRPNNSGILTLIDLKNNQNIQLYKKLLGKEEREFAETNDVPYKGDWLKFIGQKGNLLQFKNENTIIGPDTSIYTYPVPGN